METTAIAARKTYSNLKGAEVLIPPKYKAIMELADKYSEPIGKIKANSSDLNSLSRIAVKSYGQYYEQAYPNYSSKNAWQYWICIYYYNISMSGDKRLSNPNLIYPGQEFLIPPVEYINEFRNTMDTNNLIFSNLKGAPDTIDKLSPQEKVTPVIPVEGKKNEPLQSIKQAPEKEKRPPVLMEDFRSHINWMKPDKNVKGPILQKEYFKPLPTAVPVPVQSNKTGKSFWNSAQDTVSGWTSSMGRGVSQFKDSAGIFISEKKKDIVAILDYVWRGTVPD